AGNDLIEGVSRNRLRTEERAVTQQIQSLGKFLLEAGDRECPGGRHRGGILARPPLGEQLAGALFEKPQVLIHGDAGLGVERARLLQGERKIPEFLGQSVRVVTTYASWHTPGEELHALLA